MLGDKCTGNNFKCADDQCIPLNKICDGVSDCDDGSDEAHICKGDLHKYWDI